MWAKSVLLSALVATGAITSPVDVGQRAPMASMQQLFVPIQDRHRRGGDDNGRDKRSQDIRPLRDAVEEVRAQAGGGELLSARLEQGSQPFYVIRWRMPDGQVRDFRVSAVR